jgi:hypothetical protein
MAPVCVVETATANDLCMLTLFTTLAGLLVIETAAAQ